MIYENSLNKGGGCLECLNLIGEMAKRKVSKEDLSKLLGIHWNSVANKINGSSSFTVDEAVRIRDEYFPEWKIEDLFQKSKNT